MASRPVPHRKIFTPGLVITAVLLLCAIAATSLSFLDHHAKARWAKEELVPRARQLSHIEEEIFLNREAYRVAEQAEEYIPDDPDLINLFEKLSIHISVRTDPPGAKIFVKDFGAPDSTWRFAGISPLENLRVPRWYIELKMEKEGYEPVHAASLTALYRRGRMGSGHHRADP